MKIIKSQRLYYELMSRDDADVPFDLDQDEEVMRYINGEEKTSKQQIKRVMLPRMVSYRNEKQGWGLWKVLTTENKDLQAEYELVIYELSI